MNYMILGILVTLNVTGIMALMLGIRDHLRIARVGSATQMKTSGWGLARLAVAVGGMLLVSWLLAEHRGLIG